MTTRAQRCGCGKPALYITTWQTPFMKVPSVWYDCGEACLQATRALLRRHPEVLVETRELARLAGARVTGYGLPKQGFPASLKREGHRSHVSGMKRMARSKKAQAFYEADEQRLRQLYVGKPARPRPKAGASIGSLRGARD